MAFIMLSNGPLNSIMNIAIKLLKISSLAFAAQAFTFTLHAKINPVPDTASTLPLFAIPLAAFAIFRTWDARRSLRRS